jgi:hypothetical protein
MTAERAARLGRHGTPEEVADLVYSCCQIIVLNASRRTSLHQTIRPSLKTSGRLD